MEWRLICRGGVYSCGCVRTLVHNWPAIVLLLAVDCATPFCRTLPFFFAMSRSRLSMEGGSGDCLRSMISSETLKPFEKSRWSFGINVESLDEPAF